jgi:serine/threonine protein kinase
MTSPPDVKSLFGQAAELPAADRPAFLDRACAGHPAIRSEVEALLGAFDRAGSFMGSPAAPVETGDYAPIAEGEGTVIGPYTLREQIGEGGFGLVFVAEQTEPVRRKVALKVIKPGMDTRQVVARFEAERQALALMDHPNIAKVLEAGATASGRPFFVMELVRGIPITEYADAHHLTPQDRLGLFIQVCRAVQHAHQKGVIHRDLKPSNILVAPHDGIPVVKVIDFGVAKALGQALTDKTIYTRFFQMIGTPLYMSPEQAEVNQLDVDTRSDIYSLGVLLYELLTGTTPFDRERFQTAAFEEIRRIIKEEEPPRPSTRLTSLGETLPAVSAFRGTDPGKLAGLVRGELDWIAMKCLEKDRSRRYDSAAALAKDVQRYLIGDAVEACPPSLGYRLKRFARRNAAVLVIALVYFGTLKVSTVVGIWLASRAQIAELKAEQQRDEALAIGRAARAGFETEQRARRRIRELYRTSSLDMFLTAFALDADGIERIQVNRLGWAAIRFLRAGTEAYLDEAEDTPEGRSIRAEGWMWRGVDQYGRMDYAAAARSFAEAETIYRRLCADHPNAAEHRADLGECLLMSAFTADARRDSAAAARFAPEAERIARDLLAERPTDPEARYGLALILWQGPNLRGPAGKPGPFATGRTEARTLFEGLLAEAPGSLRYRIGFASVNMALAAAEGTGDAEAVRWCTDALAALDATPPDQGCEAVTVLIKFALRKRANRLGKLGRHREAVADRRRVVETAPEALITAGDRADLALELYRAGDRSEARTEAGALEKVVAVGPTYYHAAKVFALSVGEPGASAADREAWGAAAVRLARKATGVIDAPSRFEEPPFDALRDRPDYQGFLAELRAKADPKK